MPRCAGLARLAVAALLLVAGPVAGAAQSASGPWIPLGSPLDLDVRWAIDAGALRLNPLQRPFRMAALRSAVATTDSLELGPQARAALRDVLTRLTAYGDSAVLRAEGALRGYRNGRRESFRTGGRQRLTPALGVWASYATGPFVVVASGAVDERLRDDPEFAGEKATEVSGRMQTAYVAATGRTGDVVLGRVARSWGPDLFDGLQLSALPYAFDGLAGALRAGRFELSTVTQRLSSVKDTAAVPVDFNRYFFAHRLDIRIGRDHWLGLTQSGVYGGRGQGFQPAFLTPVNFALASQLNDSLAVNIILGADLALRLRDNVRLEAGAFIDDIQTDNQVLTDQRPTSYGLTAVLRAMHPVAPVQLALGYTRVSALAYRNSSVPEFAYSHQQVGLARNFSDYDELLLRLSWRPLRTWRLAADVAHFRQGSGDFRQPFPSDSILATPGQGFLVDPVRSFWAGRLTVNGEPRPGIELGGDIGFTRDTTGASQAIASAGVRLSLDMLRRRFADGFPAVERAAERGWP